MYFDKTVLSVWKILFLIVIDDLLIFSRTISLHTSHKFKAKIANRMIERKLIVCYLPTYSPELNLIEILWKKVKYEWLNLLSIMNFKEFEQEEKRVFD